MTLLKLAIVILSTVIGCLLFISFFGFYQAIRPFRLVSDITPKKFNVSYESIQFKSQDGTWIRGWWIKNKNPHAMTLILLHGYPADKGDILPATVFLHDKYNLLYLDFRYFGESGGHYSTIGMKEVDDVLSAIQYLKQKNIHAVGIWGFSLGGAVALMAAAKTNAIKVVVSDASFARLDWMAYDYYRIPYVSIILGELMRYWGLLILGDDIKQVSPLATVKQLKIPILLLHSKQDHVIPFYHGVALQEGIQSNPHATVIFRNDLQHGEQMKGYHEKIELFFLQYFPP